MKRLLIVIGAAMLAAAGFNAEEPAAAVPEQYAGNVASMGAAGPTTFRIRVHIDSYSPAEEIRQLHDLLKDKGSDALASALYKAKDRGWITVGNSLGYGFSVARSRPTEKGRRIVVVTDRPIQFGESWRSTRSMDYPLGIIVLDLKKDGTGEGQLLAAAKAKFNEDGKLEVENFGAQPYRIIRLYPEKVKGKK